MKRICTKCGNELKKEDIFCPRCGEECQVKEENFDKNKLVQNKSRLIITIIILIFLIAGLSKIHPVNGDLTNDSNVEISKGNAMGYRFNKKFKDFQNDLQEVYKKVYNNPLQDSWEAGEKLQPVNSDITEQLYFLYMSQERIMVSVSVETESKKVSSIHVMFGDSDIETFKQISAICFSAVTDMDYSKAFNYIQESYEDASKGENGYLDNLVVNIVTYGDQKLAFAFNPASDELIQQLDNGTKLTGKSSEENSSEDDEASQLDQMPQAEEDEKQEIQEQIYQTIDSAILPMTQLTVGQAITTVFSDYDIKWESYDSSNTKYEVTISGSYYPNVEVPEYETQGSIAFVVDIDAGTCEVDQDNDGVYAALLVAAQSY